MEDDGFVPATMQCPPKKRGRKKKKAVDAPEPVEPEPSSGKIKDFPSDAALGIDTRGMTFLELAALRELAEHEATAKGRPSAAALGYDTVGMTDAEVAAGEGSKIKKGARKNNRKVEDNVAPGGKDTGRKTRKQQEPEEPTSSGHADPSAVPKCKPTQHAAAAAAEKAPCPDESEPAPAPKRKSKKRAAAEQAAWPDEAEPAPAPKRKSKKPAAEEAACPDEAEPAPAPKRKSKKRAAAEEAACPDEAEPIPAPKRKPKKHAAAAESSTAEAPTASSTRKRELTAEAKAKQSRKSSAYHVARRLAKNQGKTLEEQKQAGTAVS